MSFSQETNPTLDKIYEDFAFYTRDVIIGQSDHPTACEDSAIILQMEITNMTQADRIEAGRRLLTQYLRIGAELRNDFP